MYISYFELIFILMLIIWECLDYNTKILRVFETHNFMIFFALITLHTLLAFLLP